VINRPKLDEAFGDLTKELEYLHRVVAAMRQVLEKRVGEGFNDRVHELVVQEEPS